MHIFKDRTGREWTVDITVLTVERVKAACGVDMPGLFADRMQELDSLILDHVRILPVIFECCRPAAEKAGLSMDDLKADWNGATADAALEAWLEELIGFFPDARRREALRKAIQSLKELGTRVVEKGAALLTEMEIDEGAARVIADLRRQFSPNASGESSGSTPVTLESTPAPSPSASLT